MDDGYEIKDLCFDQSGTYLGVAGTDVRLVKIINTIIEIHCTRITFNFISSVYMCKQWQELKVFNDHTALATGIRFGKHSQFIASTSMDRTLKLYGI